ncbi:hypothetical protein [Psychrobacter celer]|uniref:hypothetical protein n=1 Tax=Psychrobacter celer TaxID=306572 RepID=UPI003FD10328
MTQKDEQEPNALVKRPNNGLVTSKGRRSQIRLTTDIIKAAATLRTSSQALVDESWIQEIWDWADKFKIEDDVIPRNKLDLLCLETMEIGRYKGFKCLPKSIGNLSNLKSLNINANHLKSLPESIGNLSSLEKLTSLS